MLCSICLDTIEYTEKKLDCSCVYVYHKNCINSWLSRKNSCPICKKCFDVNNNIQTPYTNDWLHNLVGNLIDDLIDQAVQQLNIVPQNNENNIIEENDN